MIKTGPAPLILASNYRSAEACAPRADFTLLSESLRDAPLLCPPPKASGFVSSIEKFTASDLRQAVTAFRQHSRVSVYISLSERIGLPLALLLSIKRIDVPHVLVAHHLTSPKKRALQSRIRWLQRFSRIVVLSEPQAAYLREEAMDPEEHALFIPDSVDTDFWRSQRSLPITEPLVLSVGQERRDYGLLFAAARELPTLPFVVVAGSAWSMQNKVHSTLPPNVTVRRGLSYADLRDLYDRASLVVVPLEADVPYAAGANGLLEAMAMGKPVVLTETSGLSGYVRQGKNGCIVPPENPHALADAIRRIQEGSGGTADLGVEARRTAEAKHSLPSYVTALAGIIRDAEKEPWECR
jgi:glycosyltransferase involved in cell wall biosynthesis